MDRDGLIAKGDGERSPELVAGVVWRDVNVIFSLSARGSTEEQDDDNLFRIRR